MVDYCVKITSFWKQAKLPAGAPITRATFFWSFPNWLNYQTWTGVWKSSALELCEKIGVNKTFKKKKGLLILRTHVEPVGVPPQRQAGTCGKVSYRWTLVKATQATNRKPQFRNYMENSPSDRLNLWVNGKQLHFRPIFVLKVTVSFALKSDFPHAMVSGRSTDVWCIFNFFF